MMPGKWKWSHNFFPWWLHNLFCFKLEMAQILNEIVFRCYYCYAFSEKTCLLIKRLNFMDKALKIFHSNTKKLIICKNSYSSCVQICSKTQFNRLRHWSFSLSLPSSVLPSEWTSPNYIIQPIILYVQTFPSEISV